VASRHVDLDGFARALLDSAWQPGSGSGSECLEAAVALCRRWVPGASWVSVSVRSRDQVVTRAATDEQAVRIDEMQYAVGSGPCLAALAEGDLQYVPDLVAEPRWPAWWGRVQEDGVGLGGVVSHPVTPRGNDPAMSLNIYAERAGALDEGSLTTSLLLTAHLAAIGQTARSREEVLHLLQGWGQSFFPWTRAMESFTWPTRSYNRSPAASVSYSPGAASARVLTNARRPSSRETS